MRLETIEREAPSREAGSQRELHLPELAVSYRKICRQIWEDVCRLQRENQALRDEIARLKGTSS